MSKFLFKTSINCGGCVAKVKTIFDENKHIKFWSVDTSSPDKILTVETETLTPEQVIDSLSKIGYRAELL